MGGGGGNGGGGSIGEYLGFQHGNLADVEYS